MKKLDFYEKLPYYQVIFFLFLYNSCVFHVKLMPFHSGCFILASSFPDAVCHYTLTIFSFGELITVLGAVLVVVMRTYQIGTALQLLTDVSTKVVQPIDISTDFYHSSVTLAFISTSQNPKSISKWVLREAPSSNDCPYISMLKQQSKL